MSWLASFFDILTIEVVLEGLPFPSSLELRYKRVNYMLNLEVWSHF